MSFGSGHPPLLVLSKHVYAKRRDGSYYPGSIESKHDHSYTVVFADDTRDRVLEGDVTWLGFWGLPPWNWPKNPVIQPSMSTGEEHETIQDKIRFVGDDIDVQGKKPASFCLRGTNEKWLLPGSGYSSQLSLGDRGTFHCSDERVQTHACSSTEQQYDIKQPRPSVLRLNSNVLFKAKRSRIDFITPYGYVPSEETAVKSPFYRTLPSTPKYSREKFESILFSQTENELSQINNINGGFQRETDTGKSSEIAKVIYQHSFEGGRSSITEQGITQHTEVERISSVNPASRYHIQDRHENLSPPITPSCFSTFVASEPPFFGQPRGTIASKELSKQNTKSSSVAPETRRRRRRKRRNYQKKCRKVYGIINRHIWCTQCKWKKACTRFTVE